MTTIAYCNGIVASDSNSSRSEYIAAGATTKLFRVDSGVCAIIGNIAKATRLIEYLREVRGSNGKPDAPVMDNTVSVIHFLTDATVSVYEDGGVHYPTFEFMAWGSGMPAALGALYMGATAEEAVRIASRIDPWTGGNVISMKISD